MVAYLPSHTHTHVHTLSYIMYKWWYVAVERACTRVRWKGRGRERERGTERERDEGKRRRIGRCASVSIDAWKRS